MFKKIYSFLKEHPDLSETMAETALEAGKRLQYGTKRELEVKENKPDSAIITGLNPSEIFRGEKKGLPRLANSAD